MNYFFTDINDQRNSRPDINDPKIKERFSSLSEYLTIATKIIKSIGPNFMPITEVKKMLNSEDYISELARYLMIADWRYDETKGKTQYSYRNQYAIYFFKDRLSGFKTKANKSHYSLDMCLSENTSVGSLVEDKLIKEPIDSIKEEERKERVAKYIRFLINNSKLTEVQKKCVEFKYLKGIDSYEEIGESFDPPISRQAVQQALDRSLFKLQQTAKGTKGE